MKNDPVNHPAHYTNHPSGLEAIQITENMRFNLGNAIKYLWRKDLKGKHDQDIKKAIWYLTRELTRINEHAKHIAVFSAYAQEHPEDKISSLIHKLLAMPVFGDKKNETIAHVIKELEGYLNESKDSRN